MRRPTHYRRVGRHSDALVDLLSLSNLLNLTTNPFVGSCSKKSATWQSGLLRSEGPVRRARRQLPREGGAASSGSTGRRRDGRLGPAK